MMQPHNPQKQVAESYQPLFDLMSKEHGLVLTESEMQEIILKALEVSNNLDVQELKGWFYDGDAPTDREKLPNLP